MAAQDTLYEARRLYNEGKYEASERAARTAILHLAVTIPDATLDLDLVPLLGMADVVDRHVVVIAPEKRNGVEGDTATATVEIAFGEGNGGGELTIYDNLDPGTYSVQELTKTGWGLTSINCVEDKTNNSSGSATTRTATFNVQAGETVKCTFNNRQMGEISGKKYEVPEGVGPAIGGVRPIAGLEGGAEERDGKHAERDEARRDEQLGAQQTLPPHTAHDDTAAATVQ